MSDTPRAADDVQKLLDNGHTVVLYQNGLGTYTAVCLKQPWAANALVQEAIVGQFPDGDEDSPNYPRDCITDDFTPSQALYRLTEKVTTGRIA